MACLVVTSYLLTYLLAYYLTHSLTADSPGSQGEDEEEEPAQEGGGDITDDTPSAARGNSFPGLPCGR